jgi:hypothetical protein
MDIIEKILPFLAHFPRWLQIYFFAVLFQMLVLVFLGVLFSLRFTITSSQPTAVRAIAVGSEAPQSVSNAPPHDGLGSDAPGAPAKTPPKQHPGLRGASAARTSPSLRVSSVLENSGDFPVLKVSVVNASAGPIVLTAFDMQVLDYRPYASIPESHVLASIALIDVVLPFGTGVFPYKLDPPIMLAANDVVMISYRFHAEYAGKIIPPSRTGKYTIRLVLRTDNGLTSSTETVTF